MPITNSLGMVQKSNPYHDASGAFTSKDKASGSATSGARVDPDISSTPDGKVDWVLTGLNRTGTEQTNRVREGMPKAAEPFGENAEATHHRVSSEAHEKAARLHKALYDKVLLGKESKEEVEAAAKQSAEAHAETAKIWLPKKVGENEHANTESKEAVEWAGRAGKETTVFGKQNAHDNAYASHVNAAEAHRHLAVGHAKVMGRIQGVIGDRLRDEDPLDKESIGFISDHAMRMVKDGYSTDDAVSLLRSTEELNPTLPEKTALARMAAIQAKYAKKSDKKIEGLDFRGTFVSKRELTEKS